MEGREVLMEMIAKFRWNIYRINRDWYCKSDTEIAHRKSFIAGLEHSISIIQSELNED
jgi:hypothetical protein